MKAFFGKFALTIGNPFPPKSGGGGNTPFTAEIGGPTSSAPGNWVSICGQGVGSWNDTTLPVNQLLGEFTPEPAFVAGNTVLVCGWPGFIATSVPNTYTDGFMLALFGVLPQNTFATLALGPPANLTFNSATADLFDNSTYATQQLTLWAWNDPDDFTFLGDTLTVTVT